MNNAHIREQDFDRIVKRHLKRIHRIIPPGVEIYEILNKEFPFLDDAIVASYAKIRKILDKAYSGEISNSLFKELKRACLEWAMLHINSLRLIRSFNGNIKRRYSQKLDSWVYLAETKDDLKGVLFPPGGTVYIGKELKSV